MIGRLLVLAALAGAVGAAATWWRTRATSDRGRGGSGLPDIPDEWRSDDPTWVVFTSPTCAPCRGLLDLLARRAPSLAVRTVDVLDQPDLVEQYGVRSTPTVVVASPDGRVVERLVGVEAARRELEAIGESG